MSDKFQLNVEPKLFVELWNDLYNSRQVKIKESFNYAAYKDFDITVRPTSKALAIIYPYPVVSMCFRGKHSRHTMYFKSNFYVGNKAGTKLLTSWRSYWVTLTHADTTWRSTRKKAEDELFTLILGL